MVNDEEKRPLENTAPKGEHQESGAPQRQHRPRIPGRMSMDNDSERSGRPYRPRYSGDAQEGGYQPRPRFNSDREGGYQPRPRYNSDREGGYQPRPRINNDREGGYQPRPRFNNDREGGYQPRPRFSNDREGGYQPRPRFSNDREGGYQPRPRFNNDREGGYQPRPRTNSDREGGCQPRPRFSNDRESSYQPRPRFNSNDREGGYQPRPRFNSDREGGFQTQPRPRYNQQGQSSHGQQRGGFRQHSADYNPHAKYSMKKQIEYKETHIDPEEPIRLNRFLANAGVCSRREADTFISAGVVSVNGEIVTELGTKVKRSDEVRFHDQPVNIEKKVYVLLNKPKDYVTTSDDPQNRKTVMDLVQGACRERIYPVGRLDRNTTGVLLFTNDGDLATKLTHPQYMKKKVYHVHLDKNVSVEDLHKILDGIELEDGMIKADAVDYADDNDKKQVGIEIHSGKNRIVRRIFEHLGYRVCKLDRVLFAGLTKKNLRRGDWRFLTEKEVNMLRMGAFE